jgi:hypothetical protein
MEGCPGCNQSQKRKQEILQGVVCKAKEYAQQIQKLVIIYEDAEGMPQYMEGEAAKLAGVYIQQYVPHLQYPING